MSRIDELIEKLCPEGVEWHSISQVSKSIVSGGTPLTSRTEYYNGNIPWLRTQEVDWNDIYDTQIKITESGLEDSSARIIPPNCVIVAMYGATAAKVAVNKIPLATNQACCNLEINDKIAHYRYVYYWLSNCYNELRSLGEGSQSNINGQKIKSFRIPIPPLKIQNEIVDILDKLKNLEAELEARKTQYEHYREQLLNFDEKNVKWKALGEIAFYPKMRISSSKVNEFNYVGVENLLQNRQGKISSSYTPTSGNLIEFMEHDVLIGNIRPYLKKIWYSDLSGGTNGDVLVVRVKDEYNELINRKYLYIHLASDTFFDFNMKYAKGAKMPRGDKKAILNYRIPIPPIAEQERIVSILDKFDALVNDISSGLPTEIEARRKQYEYYRNKLLTFKKRSDG